MSDSPGDITELLRAARQGNSSAEARLLDLVYPELLRLARNRMDRERGNHTLQPTALVNEAYMRLTGNENADWQNRSQFFATAATIMRRILVDHARAYQAEKRGGVRAQVELQDNLAISVNRVDDILEVDQALCGLAEVQPRMARIVELRFFAGLTEDEVAALLGVSSRTVKRDWTLAKAWLRTAIGEQSRSASAS